MPRGRLSEIREEPGESNAYKYKGLKKGQFAGPHETFPINTLVRARNALARSHFAEDPQAIRRKVYKKFPALAKRKKMREGDED